MPPHVPWRYTGERADGHSVTPATYKIGLRYYDAMTQRWTQTDPLERITNPASPVESQPYTYVGNDPVNYTDPSGAISGPDLGATIGGAVLGGLAVAAFCAGTAGIGCAIGVGAVAGGVGGTLGGLAAGGSREDAAGYAVTGAVGGALAGIPYARLAGS